MLKSHKHNLTRSSIEAGELWQISEPPAAAAGKLVPENEP
jgi:hypothetical protein